MAAINNLFKNDCNRMMNQMMNACVQYNSDNRFGVLWKHKKNVNTKINISQRFLCAKINKANEREYIFIFVVVIIIVVSAMAN